jgi:nicotinate-nucleotide--dimethylbenzimidazole phosphoribosyltransferase
MTAEEFHAAWQVGEGEADQDSNAGMRLVLGGEMGIGNSTPAAALTALLTDTDVSRVVGPGAGVDAHGFMRKQSVVQSAVERERERFPTEPIPALAALAGYEIVALAGYYATAGAKHKMTILLDGFIATSAALLAAHLVPECSCYFLAAHRSAEPGHTIALRHLHLTPILDGWDLRLGEGTGALLVVPFLDAACQICCNMATLNDLGARE